jgi:hypothetical protein
MTSDNPSAALLHRSTLSPLPERTGRSSAFTERNLLHGANQSSSNDRPGRQNTNHNGILSGGKLRERLQNHLSNASSQVSHTPSPPRRSIISSGPVHSQSAAATQLNTKINTHTSSSTAGGMLADSQQQNRQAEVVKDVVSSVIGAFRRVSVLMKDKPAAVNGTNANSTTSSTNASQKPPANTGPAAAVSNTYPNDSDESDEDNSSLPDRLASTQSTGLGSASASVTQAMQEIAREHTEKQEAAATDIKSLIKKAMKKKAPQMYTYDKDSLLQNTLAAFNKKVS